VDRDALVPPLDFVHLQVPLITIPSDEAHPTWFDVVIPGVAEHFFEQQERNRSQLFDACAIHSCRKS